MRPPLFPGRTIFVGRKRERAELCRRLDAAMRVKGSVVMIGGEPGIGKTRLAEEVATEAARRKMKVLVGRCREGEAVEPDVSFVEIFESAFRQIGSKRRFRQMLGEDAAAVAKIPPALRRLFPDIPAALGRRLTRLSPQSRHAMGMASVL